MYLHKHLVKISTLYCDCYLLVSPKNFFTMPVINEELQQNPLSSLDEWEDDLLERYPDPESIVKDKITEEYRNYDTPQRDTVREFYRLNHKYQTYEFVQEKRKEFLKFDK